MCVLFGWYVFRSDVVRVWLSLSARSGLFAEVGFILFGWGVYRSDAVWVWRSLSSGPGLFTEVGFVFSFLHCVHLCA